ncbi:MAG: hypothetical protein HY048_13130 [Acidobacteria bacterium]|nr:hypothetical protein [Acidobacteriota bacterium]
MSWSILAASIGVVGAGAALLERRQLRTPVDVPVACYVLFTLVSAAAAFGKILRRT